MGERGYEGLSPAVGGDDGAGEEEGFAGGRGGIGGWCVDDGCEAGGLGGR